MESHIYDKYIYGDKEYAKLLEVLRAHLCNEFGMEYGIIIFCRYNPEEEYTESNKVKVFPINPDIINRHFPVNDEIRRNFLEAINRDRKSNELYFIKQFRTGSDCLKITIEDKEELLQHSKDFINRNSWGDSYISITNSGELNILDQLFFKSNQPEFDVIPIPVLTSPAILLVIPYNFLDENKKKEVYKTISESIHTYLFNKLINEINTDITISGINNKFSLIKSYLKVISEVIIPINYSFANEETRCFDWYGNYDTLRGYQFKLNLGGEDISFMLPNFHWVDGNLISDHKYYNVKENQFKETIESIYKLIYKNWEAVRDVEMRALAAYKKTITEAAINPTIIKGVIEQMQSVHDTLEKALKINIDDFSQTLNTITTNRVIFELITENPNNNFAYRIIFNGQCIYTQNSKIPHFGYMIFKEIINKKKIHWNKFTFIEDIKSELNKNHTYLMQNQSNTNSEKNQNELSDQSSRLAYSIESSIELFPYPDDDMSEEKKNKEQNKMNKFVDAIKNAENPAACLAAYLRPIQNAFKTFENTVKNNDPPIWKKLTNRLNILSKIKKELQVDIPNFDDLYKIADTKGLDELRFIRREVEGSKPDADRYIKGRICNNYNQVIECFVKQDNILVKHLEKSGLKSIKKTIDNFKYDDSEIDSTLFIEWVFN